MRKDDYEIKEYIVRDKVLIKKRLFCDVCKQEIITSGNRCPHWSLTTGHNDWGNDSCESIMHFDLCSKECLTKKFEEYLKDSDSDHNSEYFEIEHDNWID